MGRILDWLKKHKKRLIISAALLLLGVFILLNVVSYNQAYAMTHFTAEGERTAIPEKLSLGQKMKVLLCGVSVPRPRAKGTPADLGIPFEERSIRCSNGITLGAWYCPAPENEGLALLFHGYAGEKSTELTEASHFHALGWSVLMVDFRGSGQSSESYTSIGFCEAEDVAEAVRFAQANLPHSPLVLYGQSMGGAAILRAVSECGVKPDALIVEGVFDSMWNTVRNRFSLMGVPTFPCAQLLMFWGGRQMNFDPFSHNPADYAKNVSCPALLMHGSDDPRAHIDEGRRVFDAIPAPKQFKEFKGARHESFASHFAVEWNAVLADFLHTVHAERTRKNDK
jgi:alpha-beta hydrolase superfamily lysophospholipase